MPEAPVARLASAIEALLRAHRTAPPGRFRRGGAPGALPRLHGPLGALGEAHRVLRRGGTVAIQDLVGTDGARAADIPGWTPTPAAERVAALERLGFVEIALRDRTGEAPERSAQILAARDRLPARPRP